MNNPPNPAHRNLLPPKKTFLKLMQQEKGMSRKEAMKAWLLKERLWLKDRRKEPLPEE